MGTYGKIVTFRAMLQESQAQAAQLEPLEPLEPGHFFKLWTVTRYASHGCHEQHGHEQHGYDGLWLGRWL